MFRKAPFIISLFTSFLVCTQTPGQMMSGAKWTFIVEQEKEGEATLVFKAEIKENFHIYSQSLPSDDGPLPTVFEFNPGNTFELTGKVAEEAGHEIFDEAFQMKLLTFEKTAFFKQKVKVLSKEKFQVTGKLSFMACDNKMCLPPEDVPFTFNINSK